MASGELRVYTLNRPDCYFRDGDRDGGFEYDLAKAFADYLGVSLKIRTAGTLAELLHFLETDPAGILAAPLPVGIRRDSLQFTLPYTKIRPSILTRRNATPYTSLRDLGGMTVPAAMTAPPVLIPELANLDIRITDPDLPFDALISRVMDRQTPAVLTSSRLACLYRRYNPEVRVLASLDTRFPAAWGVHKRAEILKKRLDTFLENASRSGLISALENRHYFALDHFDADEITAFHRRIEKRLPIYLPRIRSTAQKFDVDWRLIAALIYQESHYDPNAVSQDGAIGLMQVMPETGAGHGASDLFDPDANILAGVRHFRALYDFFNRAPDEDRIAITLAAYNAGQGHVFDARNIARDLELDPDRWASLATTLPLLMQAPYYRKALYGYCRGTEPVEYVRNVLIYYDIIKKKTAVSTDAGLA